MIRNPQPNVMIHDVTGADIKIHAAKDVYWFNIGTRLDVFSTSLEEIRNIGHELIRQANELDAKLAHGVDIWSHPSSNGDLLLVEYKREDGHPVFELELVSSVNRQGEVLRTIRFYFGHESDPEPTHIYEWNALGVGVIGTDQVDTARAWQACQSRPDARYDWAPMRFDTIDDVRAFLSTYLLPK